MGAPGCLSLSRQQFAEAIRNAGRYAVRTATMNGKEQDFDPDALLHKSAVSWSSAPP